MKKEKKETENIKRLYKSPKLVSYGTISQVTRNTNKQNPAIDGASNPGQNKTAFG